MSSDEIVWQVINQQFCSFKLKYSSRTRGTSKLTIVSKDYKREDLLP
jgi:hypothetical protein